MAVNRSWEPKAARFQRDQLAVLRDRLYAEYMKNYKGDDSAIPSASDVNSVIRSVEWMDAMIVKIGELEAEISNSAWLLAESQAANDMLTGVVLVRDSVK